jgi:hypothetical protein
MDAESEANDESESEITEVTATDVANRSDDAIIANDPLVSMLTPGTKVRILSALIAVGGEKLNPSAICERAAISRDGWYEHRDDLVETFGVIEEAAPAGNSPMYRVDMEDPLVKRIREARDLAAANRNRATDPARD